MGGTLLDSPKLQGNQFRVDQELGRCLQLCAYGLTLNRHQSTRHLKEMGIPDYLTCLLRNLFSGQEAAVRTGHGTRDWFQIGKGVRQGCILSPCLFNLYAEYLM